MNLTQQEMARYARHLTLDGVGQTGQQKLKQARVLLIGAGGLGSPVALYLAAAGVGTIGLCDHDTVELSNLQRQILHSNATTGQPKATSGAATLARLNDQIQVNPICARLDQTNAAAIIADYDLVVDGSDNFATRYLVNDACYGQRKPLVTAAVMGFEGQLTVILPDQGPCYRCVFPTPPPPELAPNCAAMGVLGVLPGTLGCLQATEVLKLILGIGTPSSGKLLCYDALNLSLRPFTVSRDEQCPVCSQTPAATNLRGAGQQTPQQAVVATITCQALRQSLGTITIVDVRDPAERAVASIQPSLNLPLKDLAANHHQIPSGQPIVLYCQSGVRSAIGVELLAAKGVTALSVQGGIEAWLASDPNLAAPTNP